MKRDLDALLAAMRGYLPGGERITGIAALSEGHSNGTYLLEGIGRVLRMPPAEEGLLPPYDMARQHAILRAVGRAPGAPPVPRVFELCEDATVAGDSFLIMEHIEGETFDRHHLPPWLTADLAAQDRYSADWVETIAAVHRLPPHVIGGPTRTPSEEAAHWLALARGVDAPGELVDLLGGLVADPPPRSGPLTAVHGDPNPTNLLWRDGRCVALLDWELAGVGEPLADIGMLMAYIRDHDEPESWGISLPRFWDRPRIAAHWEACTGRKAVAWRHHEIAAMAKLSTILLLGDRLYAEGRATDPRFLTFKTRAPAYMERLRWRLAKI